MASRPQGDAQAVSPVTTREELRYRLAAVPGATVEERWLHGDDGVSAGALARDRSSRPAAVLIGLVARPEGPRVLLTQRADHLRDHAGQISFPGGRIEAHDVSFAAAALREAHEEIGLDPNRVEMLGALAPYATVTGFRIHPVVGWLEPPLELAPDPLEVADVFELPLAFVLDRANHCRQSYRRGPLTRTYYVLPYEDRFIWGATAGILVNLSCLLQA